MPSSTEATDSCSILTGGRSNPETDNKLYHKRNMCLLAALLPQVEPDDCVFAEQRFPDKGI